MSSISKNIFLSILILLVINVVGCGEKEPTEIQPVYNANALLLRPLNLPTVVSPSQSCYELWLVDFEFTVDEDSNDIRVVRDELSLGKFYWDRVSYRFFDLQSQPRDSVFKTDGANVFDFNTVMITVEPLADDGVRSNNGLIFFEISDPSLPIEGQFNFFDRAAYDVVLEYTVLQNDMRAGYVLRTYSDDGNAFSNPLTGIWFHADSTTQAGRRPIRRSLYFPILTPNAAFTYEGWVVMEDSLPRPLSTGKFRNPAVEDWENTHLGNFGYPNVPGEDFITNPPADFEFPLTFAGEGYVCITLEPYPDPEPDAMFPFVLFKGALPTTSDEDDINREDFELGSEYFRLPKFEAVPMEL
jgi:hypothetical protein